MKKNYKNSIDINKLLAMKYRTYNLNNEWIKYIGEVERGFKMLVYGLSGSGKTTFVMKLCKELAMQGKVYFNSIEQGNAKSLQNVAAYCNMQDIPKGKMVIGDRDNFETMKLKIKSNKAVFIVIDSLDYINLTTAQYKELIRLFPSRSFIIISWAEGDKPKSQYAKAIEYMADIKTYVNKGVAISRSRFGNTEPCYIFNKPKNLFNF